MILWLLLLFAAPALGLFSRRLSSRGEKVLASLPVLFVFAAFLQYWPEVFGHEIWTRRQSWIPSMGIDLSWRLEGWSYLFALLITGIGATIITYTQGYMEERSERRRLTGLLYFFMAAMLGVVVSDHLIQLFIFWELTSLASYLLISFNNTEEKARWNAFQALTVTGFGGLAMLAGFILLGLEADSFYLSELVFSRPDVAASPLYGWMLFFVFLGALTKSAQIPFHFWLPNAMVAPTPVSAFLHSATMVKAGVFILGALLPVLGGTSAWTLPLVFFGGITFLWGVISGLMESDLKRILAFTTLSVLGLLTFMIGLGTYAAMAGATLFLLAHALYKAALFMTTGSVDHATHTRELDDLEGLARFMPWTAGIALLAALSKCGIPPFAGFIGKEYVYKGALGAEFGGLAAGVLVAGNILMTILAIRVGFFPFWRNRKSRRWEKAHEAPLWMTAGPFVLAVLSLLLAVFPSVFLQPVLDAMKATVFPDPKTVPVKLWPGINLALGLSVLTVAGGFAGAWWGKRKRLFGGSLPIIPAEEVFRLLFDGVSKGSKLITVRIQSGYLRHYILIILITALGIIGWKLLRFGDFPSTLNFTGFSPLHIILLLMAFSAYRAVVSTSRVGILISLGGLGYGVSLVFAWYSAPDLAITQILVETLTVVLFALVLYRIPVPRFIRRKNIWRRDAVISLGAGLFLSILLIKASYHEIGAPISETLKAWSYAEAYGRNIVNVILVDFRALDTMGEILVLGIAALGVWILVGGLFSGKEHPADEVPQVDLLSTAARILAPILFFLSLVILYRGHHLPGGGFIGGLTAACGIFLFAMSAGWEEARKFLRFNPVLFIALGLALALLSGTFALFQGEPFLTGQWWPKWKVPLLGDVHLGTPLLFDVGVYFAVFGFSVKTAFAMGGTR